MDKVLELTTLVDSLRCVRPRGGWGGVRLYDGDKGV